MRVDNDTAESVYYVNELVMMMSGTISMQNTSIESVISNKTRRCTKAELVAEFSETKTRVNGKCKFISDEGTEEMKDMWYCFKRVFEGVKRSTFL